MGTTRTGMRAAVVVALLALPLPAIAAENIIGDGFACSVWNKQQVRALRFPAVYKQRIRSFVGCVTLEDALILFGLDKKGRIVCSGTGNFVAGVAVCGIIVGGPE